MPDDYDSQMAAIANSLHLARVAALEELATRRAATVRQIDGLKNEAMRLHDSSQNLDNDSARGMRDQVATLRAKARALEVEVLKPLDDERVLAEACQTPELQRVAFAMQAAGTRLRIARDAETRATGAASVAAVRAQVASVTPPETVALLRNLLAASQADGSPAARLIEGLTPRQSVLLVTLLDALLAVIDAKVAA